MSFAVSCVRTTSKIRDFRKLSRTIPRVETGSENTSKELLSRFETFRKGEYILTIPPQSGLLIFPIRILRLMDQWEKRKGLFNGMTDKNVAIHRFQRRKESKTASAKKRLGTNLKSTCSDRERECKQDRPLHYAEAFHAWQKKAAEKVRKESKLMNFRLKKQPFTHFYSIVRKLDEKRRHT